MAIGKNVLQGNSVSKNGLPEIQTKPVLTLHGEFSGKPASFSLGEDVLSKHMMLVGGTGCGKSTLFYHIIEQIKRKMTSDDVMVIFDSKGAFFSKFYNKDCDCIIGNSSQYIKQSQRWNIFKEVLADGWDERQIIMNAQEICKALFEERTKNNSSNPFFPNAARDLLSSILVTTVRLGEGAKQFIIDNLIA